MSIVIPNIVSSYQLDAADRDEIDSMLTRLSGEYASAESFDFLADSRRHAYHLPHELVKFFERFRRTEFVPIVTVTGLDVDDERIGPTPSHWGTDSGLTDREELFFILLGSLLGDPYGWATLQSGRLIQNVVPIRNQEYEQSGHGSLATLAWHTEDGFDPFRCDYLGLLGLRNHGRVPTTVASVDALELTPNERRTLSEPRFLIRPDDEHVKQRHGSHLQDAARNSLPEDWIDPKPVAVLFGDIDQPYLRIDPIFMCSLPGDDGAKSALAAIVSQLERGLQELVIEAGTVCFIDNFRAVHGRKSFRSRYDGTDRWLKKLLLARDLRKSRAARQGPEGRVLNPTMLAGASEAGP